MDLIDNSNYYFDYINEPTEITNLNKQIKHDGDKITQGIIPRVLELDNYVICLKERDTNKICSFIHFSIRNNFQNLDKIIYINYSYTFITHRKKGLNKMLRLVLESACKLNDCKAIVSVPFPESESRIVMNKLGYINTNTGLNSDIFIKYII